MISQSRSILAAAVIGFLLAGWLTSLPGPLTIGALIAVAASLACVVNPRVGLLMVAVAAPLGAEFEVGSVVGSGERVTYAAPSASQQLPLTVSLYDALLISLWVGVLFRGFIRQEIRFHLDRVGIGGLLFCLVAAGSVLILGSGLEPAQRLVCMLYAIKLLEVTTLYILATTIMRDHGRFTVYHLYSFITMGVLAIGTYGILADSGQILGITFIQDRMNYYGFLVLAVPILFARASRVYGPALQRYAAIALIVVSCAVVLWSDKRALLLGLVIGLAVITWRRRLWIWGLCGALVFVLVPTLFPAVRQQFSQYVFSTRPMLLSSPGTPAMDAAAALITTTALASVEADPSWAERLQKLVQALIAVPEVWWSGYGFWSSIYRLNFDPHNLFVRILLELGVFGLLLFGWWMRQVILSLRSAFLFAPDQNQRDLAEGAWAATIALLVMGATGDTFYFFQVMASYWLLVAFAIGPAGSVAVTVHRPFMRRPLLDSIPSRTGATA